MQKNSDIKMIEVLLRVLNFSIEKHRREIYVMKMF